jgi:hypothetical protein
VHSTLAYVSPMQIEQTWLVAQARQFMISVMGYAIQGQGQLHSKLGDLSPNAFERKSATQPPIDVSEIT